MKRIILAAAVAISTAGFGSYAVADTCENQTAYQERALGIPAYLLTAIARAESGRYDQATGQVRAWPWTVTSPEGDIKYATKWEAIDAVVALQKRGVTNIDVGCMQINLRHHPNAFSNLNIAFEPAYNVAYGAGVLVDNYRRTGEWMKAVALYHSSDLDRGAIYQARVDDLWQQVRADADYVGWVADGANGSADDRAQRWADARAWIDSHPVSNRWTYRNGGADWRWWTFRTYPADPGHPWRPGRFVWYGDRDGGHDRILPVYPGTPWRPVGTSRFN